MSTAAPGDWLDALCQRERLDLVGDLAGGLAHELNNALGIVIGHLDLLVEDLEADGDRARSPLERARTVHAWTDTALTAARRLYAVSRTLRQAEGPTDAAPLIAAAVSLCDYRCQREGIRLVADQVPGPAQGGAEVCVAASPRQVLQVVVHLVHNAREAIARQGPCRDRDGVTIRVAPRVAGDRLRVVVEDDGPGVPPHRTEAIFAPGVSAKAEPGCGYGLPVARRIAVACGGTLRAEAAPGGCFVLDLPLA